LQAHAKKYRLLKEPQLIFQVTASYLLVNAPLKLLVFVAADGWSLVVRTLLDSVRGLPS
jgi:hypothetical protein